MRYLKAMPVICCFLLLGGCASTYSDTKSNAPRVYSSKLELSIAAKCVLRNIDERHPEIIASVTPEAPRPNVLEIRGRSTVGFAAIIEIEASADGSNITTWISNHYPGKGSVTDRITKGC